MWYNIGLMDDYLEKEAQRVFEMPRSMARFRSAIELMQSLGQPIDTNDRLCVDLSPWSCKVREILMDRPREDDTYTPEEVREIVAAMEKTFSPAFRGLSKDERIAAVFTRAADGSLSYNPRFLTAIVSKLQEFMDHQSNLGKLLKMTKACEDFKNTLAKGSRAEGICYASGDQIRAAAMAASSEEEMKREVSRIVGEGLRKILTETPEGAAMLTETRRILRSIRLKERRQAALQEQLMEEMPSAKRAKIEKESAALQEEIAKEQALFSSQTEGLVLISGPEARAIFLEMAGGGQAKVSVPKKVAMKPGPAVRPEIDVREGRFGYSRDFTAICEYDAKDCIIHSYYGFKAPKAQEVVKKLFEAARKKKGEGWVQSQGFWRGAFQSGVYARFKREQIQVGANRTPHQGHWRLR